MNTKGLAYSGHYANYTDTCHRFLFAYYRKMRLRFTDYHSYVLKSVIVPSIRQIKKTKDKSHIQTFLLTIPLDRYNENVSVSFFWAICKEAK